MTIGSRALAVAALARTADAPTRARPRVSLIIPARNEARNLVHVLPYIPSLVDEVILVDGRSTDDTLVVAKRLLPGIVIVHQTGKGKGDALRAGFAASTGDILVMMDADGSTDPGEIGRYVQALVDGADFAKGSRFARGGGSADITEFRKLGNRGLSALVNLLYHTRYSDLCYGYNAFLRDCLECLTVDCDGFEVETLLCLRAHKARLQIAEVPSYEHTRIHGASNLQAIRDGLRVVRTILQETVKGRSTVTDARCIPTLAWRHIEREAARRGGAEVSVVLRMPPALREARVEAESPTDGATRGFAGADVSVVIAAYNDERWDELVAAVESVRGQTLRAHEIVVVIDHNDALLRRARQRWTDVRVVANVEGRGLSGARNTGIAITSGELIAFLDDDAVAEPEWLERLARACENPLVLGAGGWVQPEWRAGKPRWFPEQFGWVVGCSYEGLPRGMAPVRNLIGSSMCIRRDVFAGVGGFRNDIGRVGARPMGCEETELCVRALQRWPQSLFVLEPEARIAHNVPAKRSRWGYFFSRCFFEGRSKASVVRSVGKDAGLASERVYTLAVLPLGVVRGLRDAGRHLDGWGVARAFAIVAGFAVTTTGYVSGKVWTPGRTAPSAAAPLEAARAQIASAQMSSSLWKVRQADAV